MGQNFGVFAANFAKGLGDALEIRRQERQRREDMMAQQAAEFERQKALADYNYKLGGLNRLEETYRGGEQLGDIPPEAQQGLIYKRQIEAGIQPPPLPPTPPMTNTGSKIPPAQPFFSKKEVSFVNRNPVTGEEIPGGTYPAGTVMKDLTIPESADKVKLAGKIAEEKKLAQLNPAEKKSIYKMVGDNNYTRMLGKEILDILPQLPSGKAGQAEIWAKRALGSKDPVMAKVQKVKSFLTKFAQLPIVQYTKGAVSDTEMKLFATASANLDVQSLPAIEETLKEVIRKINLEEDSALDAYTDVFGDDPREWSNIKKKMNRDLFDSGERPKGLPKVGESFQGGKVIGVRRIE